MTGYEAWVDVLYTKSDEDWVNLCGKAMAEIQLSLLTALTKKSRVTGESLEALLQAKIDLLEVSLCND